MKVKLGQLFGVSDRMDSSLSLEDRKGPITKLLENEQFCMRLSNRLARLAKAIQKELETLNATRNKLIEKHGTVHDDSKSPSIQPEDASWPAFAEEYDNLMQDEIELGLDVIELPPDATGVSGAMLLALKGLVKVKGEEDEPEEAKEEEVEKVVGQVPAKS